MLVRCKIRRHIEGMDTRGMVKDLVYRRVKEKSENGKCRNVGFTKRRQEENNCRN